MHSIHWRRGRLEEETGGSCSPLNFRLAENVKKSASWKIFEFWAKNIKNFGLKILHFGKNLGAKLKI